MKNYLKSVIVLVASALLITFSTSCGTIRGFGRDVERTGDTIHNAASR